MNGSKVTRQSAKQMIRRLGTTAILVGLGTAPASPDVLRELGLVTPFLSMVSGNEATTPIDIGADGSTDFLVIGGGVLLGSTVLNTVGSSHVIHLVVRDPEIGWRHIQTFRFPAWRIRLTTTVDLDRDGLEDLLVLLEMPDDTGRVVFLRQTTEGRLEEADWITIPYSRPRWFWAIPDHGGLVLAVDEVPSTKRGSRPIEGTLMQWDAVTGFQILWESQPIPPEPLAWVNPIGLISTSAGPALAAGGYWMDRGWVGVVLPLGDTGWGSPDSTLPYHILSTSDTRPIRFERRTELWTWGTQAADTLYMITPEAEGGGFDVQAVPISGMTRNETPRYGWISLTSGERTFLCRDAVGLGETDPSDWLLVEVDHDRSARLVPRWETPSDQAVNLAMDPHGQIELLWSSGCSRFLLPPTTQESSPPDRAMEIARTVIDGDFDGNGLTDLVAIGAPEGMSRALCLLSGIRQPPWFKEPVCFGSEEELRKAWAGDLDGDGIEDLLCAFRHLNSEGDYLVPYYWNGWRLEAADAGRIEWPESWETHPRSALLGDYDGDGLAELLVRRTAFIGWTPDRRPRPIVPLDGTIPGYESREADLDGDGRSEIVSVRSSSVFVTRLDPDAGTAETVNTWASASGYPSIYPLNLDTDAGEELLLLHLGETSIWDYGDGFAEPPTTDPGPRFYHWGDLVAGDLDLDGRIDLIRSSSEAVQEITLDALGRASVHHTMVPEVLTSIEITSSASMRWIDVDLDRDLDLVVICKDGIRVHRNTRIERAPSPSTTLSVRLAGPNPTRGSARVAVRLDRPGPVSLALYGIDGRLVWGEERWVETASWFEVVVDPRPMGRSPAAGIYFLSVRGERDETVQQIVLLP